MTDVTLREHLEVLIGERDRALELQAKEYSRRLDDLNHAHRRAEQAQTLYVSRAEFEALKQRYEERHEELLRAITIAETTHTVFSANTATAIAAFTALTGLGVLLFFLIHG